MMKSMLVIVFLKYLRFSPFFSLYQFYHNGLPKLGKTVNTVIFVLSVSLLFSLCFLADNSALTAHWLIGECFLVADIYISVK